MLKVFDTPGPLSLAIDLGAGDISLEAIAGTETTVDLVGVDEESLRSVQESRVELRELPAGGHELVIEVPPKRGLGGLLAFGRSGVRLRVTCPEGTRVAARSKSADVIGRGHFGPVDVSTASGDVAFDRVDGDAEAKTASGDIELGWISGRASAQSASGDVALGLVEGHASANSVSGDVVVRDARADVAAHTVSGDQRLEAVCVGVIQSNSVSGDIRIGVRRGSRVFLDCNTMSGDTSSELELSSQPVADEGPLVEVRAKTVSGDVRIVRAAAITEEVTA